MAKDFTTGLREFDPSQNSFCLRACIIHEDADSGARARNYLSRCANRLALADPFEIHLCSFERLADAAVRRAAANEVSDFDLIIFSVRNIREWPVTVKEWLREWLIYRDGKPCAMTVLFDGSPELVAAAPLLGFLQRMAKIGGVDLIDPFQNVPAKLAPHNQAPSVNQSARGDQTYYHWGIND